MEQGKENLAQAETKEKLITAMQTAVESEPQGTAAISIESNWPAGFREIMEAARKEYGREWVTSVTQEFLDAHYEATKSEPEEAAAEEAKEAVA